MSSVDRRDGWEPVPVASSGGGGRADLMSAGRGAASNNTHFNEVTDSITSDLLFFTKSELEKITTLSGGSLGSWIDEERS